MPTPANPELYASVKEVAKRKFKRWPSAYGSAWLTKRYLEEGGTFLEKKDETRGVSRWMEERWIQVVPYLTNGKIVRCGERKDAAKACRPLVRVTDRTPITIDELTTIHSKAKLVRLARQKIHDMDGTLYWKRGVFKPSGK
jgi:hypothetical protein